MPEVLQPVFQDELISAVSMTQPLPQNLEDVHKPAMVEEVLTYLAPKPGAVIVDATIGAGGHSLSILPRILPEGRLIAFDRDRSALEIARKRLSEYAKHITWFHENFRNIKGRLKEIGMTQIDGLLVDLGMSSLHVDRAERGFSFLKEGPLDMRMDVREGLTASMLVNELPIDRLEVKIRQFGEERYARRIARQIGEVRRQKPILTTTELADLIKKSVPVHARFSRIHPATRTFQALRIAVNDEMGSLQETLFSLRDLLAPSARVVILSFHSLEDRMVKRAFIEGKQERWWSILTKKPITPSTDEIEQNSRVRSVKLRAIERTKSK